MNLMPFFKLMAERQASDLFLSANAPITIKIQGMCYPVNNQILGADHVKQLVYQTLTPQRIARFEQDLELNFGLALADIGNFRINVFKSRGSVAMVVRFIRPHAASLEELHMPTLLADLIMEKRGIILVVGATGSGKSSTVSAMLEHRNQHHSGHMLTVEDPIEYLFSHKKSLVNQREIGVDTHSYGDALKNAMREAPDVLMLDELRDRQTVTSALQYAQAGHLCISTLPANNSEHSLARLINFFPQEARASLLYDLSSVLKAIVSQRLVHNKQGKLIPAVEILLNTARIPELIRNGQLAEIKDAMEQNQAEGSQTVEQSLYRLYRAGEIELDEALRNADSASTLSWMINNAGPGAAQEQRSPPQDDDAAAAVDLNFNIPLH